MRNFDSRLTALERVTPDEIVLLLKDGTEFHHRGTELQFLREAKQQQTTNGPVFRALSAAVSARGCSGLWKLMRAVWRCGPE